MQNRFRTLEHLIRSKLEAQAAMMSAMTQMQQALLSGIVIRKAEDTSGKTEQEIKPEDAGSKTDQQAATPNRDQAVQKREPAPRQRQSKQARPKPSWFEGRGDSHHLSEAGVKHLLSLFDQGLSQSEAARRMGITPSAVRRRFRECSEKQAA